MQVHLHKARVRGGSSAGAQTCIFDWETSGNYFHKPHVVQSLFLFSFGKSFASLGIMQYTVWRGMAQWLTVQHGDATVQMLSNSSPSARKFFWIRLGWIIQI